jgi:predicted  nucleic acid-binding Zn-ribbon protein
MAMDQAVTKKDLSALESRIDKKIDKAVDELTDVMKSFMHQVSDEFKEVKQEIVDLKVSHDRLLNTVDAFIKRLDEQETENAARDA